MPSKSNRAVIVRLWDKYTKADMINHGVNHFVIPANKSDGSEIWKDLMQVPGSVVSVIQTPASTSTQAIQMAEELGTKTIFVDLTSILPLNQSLITGLDPEKYNIVLLANHASYDDWAGSGILNFKHRFAMLFSNSVQIETNLRKAREYGGCIPAFFLLSFEDKQRFSEIQELISEFSETVLFWSATTLSNLMPMPGPVTDTQPSAPNPALGEQIQCLVQVSLRVAPSMSAAVDGVTQIGHYYNIVDVVQTSFLKFGKIVLESGQVRYVVLGQKDVEYFTAPETVTVSGQD